MASSDSPQDVLASDATGEDEPLLGRPGDVSQQDNQPLWYNLGLGTASLAQAGIWIFVGVIWGDILAQDLILFSAHPLLNSAGILLLVQAILILQPTHTAAQKTQGTYVHALLNAIGVLLLLAGLAVIEYNKGWDPSHHFTSVHGILGVATYAVFALQALVGTLVFFAPAVFGGPIQARKLYKYHRVSGYAAVVLGFVTVGAATFTTFNVAVLHVKLWAVVVTALLTLVGIVPRIKKQKIGL